MNNNYNYYGNYNPYGNFTRGIPNTFNNSFRSVPNMMYQTAGMRNTGGFLSRLFPSLSGASAATGVSSATSSGITFSGILNGASKTLGVINQAIPVFYQIKPIWNNAKTMLRVAKAMNSNDFSELDKIKVNNTNRDSKIEETKSNNKSNSLNSDSGPTFFN